VEHKAVFVGLTVGDDNIGELLYNFDGRSVHQVYGAAVIGLSKILAFGKSGETSVFRPVIESSHRTEAIPNPYM
jgi:hypothetical protein